MSKERNITVNKLPSPTFRWLGMNSALLPVPEKLKEGKPVLKDTEELSASETDYTLMRNIAGGMGEELDRMAEESGIPVREFRIGAGISKKDALCIRLHYGEGEQALNLFSIRAEEGSELTIFMDFSSEKAGYAGVQTKLSIEKGARVRLIQVQRLGEDFCFFHDIGAKTGEGAEFDEREILLSGRQSFHGIRTDLSGRESRFESAIGYLLKKEECLDINLIANHIGERTESRIDSDGVLRDHAFKLFRGTIDLRKGAKGAVGNEMETVLLMNDTVVNQTVPVILCDEEDVEGNHGASIGRLDEDMLFYMQSRGMEKEAVYEMMADAKIDAVINGILDEKLREQVKSYRRREDEEAV